MLAGLWISLIECVIKNDFAIFWISAAAWIMWGYLYCIIKLGTCRCMCSWWKNYLCCRQQCQRKSSQCLWMCSCQFSMSSLAHQALRCLKCRHRSHLVQSVKSWIKSVSDSFPEGIGLECTSFVHISTLQHAEALTILHFEAVQLDVIICLMK